MNFSFLDTDDDDTSYAPSVSTVANDDAMSQASLPPFGPPIIVPVDNGGSDSDVAENLDVTIRPPNGWNAHSFIVTWPRDNTDKQQRLDQLVDKLRRYGPNVVVSHEQHEDGEGHLHAFIKCDSKLRFRSSRFFDFDGMYHDPITRIIIDLCL